MRRNALYLFISGACVAGYLWLYVQHQTVQQGKVFGACIIKHVTDVPCPSCGSTRAVIAVLNGDFIGSIMMNPFGIILVLIIIGSPLWIIFDIATSRSTLWKMYNRMESLFRQRWIAFASISLVMMNWIWNIYKDV
jgi:hypothetical protein